MASLFTRSMRRATVVALSFAAVLVAPSAYAQAPAPSATSTPSTSQAVLVADINFLNIGVHFATSTRTVSANAVIQNSTGSISNAIFGLELSSKGAPYAAYSSQRITLAEGGIATQDVALEIPLEVSGDVSVLAVIRSVNGVMLAAEPIWSGTIPSGLTGADPLSCKPGQSSVSCTVAKGQYSLSYTIYQNALGGRDRLPVTVDNAGGTTLSIPSSPLPAGQYVALLELSDAKNTVVAGRSYDLFVPGAQGGIDTYLIETQDNGAYHITVTSHAFASTSDFALAFQGENKTVPCGTPLTVPVKSAVTQTTFTPGCSIDSIAATLSAGTVVLDTASAYAFPKPAGNSPWTWPIIIVVVVLIIIGLVAAVMRKRVVTPVPVMNNPINPNPPTPYA